MQLRDILFPALCLAALLPAMASAQTISTVAGNGGSSNTGDGGQAIVAETGAPIGVVAAQEGGFYIGGWNLIRHVRADGSIHTIAGDGTYASSGDGGPASAARIGGNIGGLALGPDGSLYIGDGAGSSVRKISENGIISTVVSGVTPNALAFDPAGNLYIAGGCRVFKLREGVLSGFAGSNAACGNSSGDGGLATAAGFAGGIQGVAVDATGNVWIGDSQAHVIRKVSADGIIVTASTVAYAPMGLSADAAGNVYAVDRAYGVVQRIASDGTTQVVAGKMYYSNGFAGDGGPAIEAKLDLPWSISVGNGHLLIADSNNHRIRRVTAEVSALPFIPSVTCASEGYTGTKLIWCQNICEKGYTGATLNIWIQRWIGRYRDLPYCAAD